MALKNNLILLGFFLIPVTFSFSQNTEEQRKYLLEKDSFLLELEQSSTALSGLSIHTHSLDTYEDIYMDTPTYDLFKKGYSLRFRKRKLVNNEISYSLQLKSEMTESSCVRMEVDEAELDFYKVKSNGNWIPLTTILDQIFQYLENKNTFAITPEIQTAINLLTQWIHFKSTAPITPFQKLRFLESDSIGVQIIENLKPVMVGSSIRNRAHVYIDPLSTTDELKQIHPNKIANSEMPKFFKKHPSNNWVLEISVDKSRFYSMLNPASEEILISELEVENKYYEKIKGATILDSFEKNVLDYYHLKKEYASKYKQSLLILMQ